MLDKIDTRKLNEVAYEKIKDGIINNFFKPGDKLNMEDLSNQLGVSRTPISNALKALEKDNYVVIFPQSGTHVRALSDEELGTIYDLREQVEGLIIRLIIPVINSTRLVEFKAEFEKYMAVEEFNEDMIYEFFNLELIFHDYLTSLCPPIIKSEIVNIIDLTKRSRKLNLAYEIDQGEQVYIKEEDIKLHISLIDAILEGDIGTAERLARKDVRQTKEDVLKNLYKAENRDQ